MDKSKHCILIIVATSRVLSQEQEMTWTLGTTGISTKGVVELAYSIMTLFLFSG